MLGSVIYSYFKQGVFQGPRHSKTSVQVDHPTTLIGSGLLDNTLHNKADTLELSVNVFVVISAADDFKF